MGKLCDLGALSPGMVGSRCAEGGAPVGHLGTGVLCTSRTEIKAKSQWAAGFQALGYSSNTGLQGLRPLNDIQSGQEMILRTEYKVFSTRDFILDPES